MQLENWATWLIFGLLILALVGFLLFTFLKDKRKNRKIAEKRIELRRATVKASKELAIKIYTLIEINKELIDQVKPGTSKIKMKDVTNSSRIFLKEIYDSKTFKVIYIESDEADPQYAINLKKLIDTNSNLWYKYCNDEIKYFKNLNDQLINDSKYEELLKESKEMIMDNFNSEVDKK